jgi:ribosomal protein L7/L12
MKITTEKLIEMLKPNPVNDRDIGFNSAVIQILQTQHDPIVENLKSRFEIYRTKLRGYNDFTKTQLEEFDGYLLGDVKLQAVKFHKEITGLGLRESKDNIDILFDMIKMYK